MSSSLNRFVLAAAAAVMLGGCDSDTLAPSDVIGDTWTLVSLQEAGATPIVVENPARYTLQFSSEGRLLVRSDCNSCGGSYSLTDSLLEVGPLACTRAYCGDASLDAKYTTMLQGARSVVLGANEIAIQGSGGILRLKR